jgi:hypothetical protein
MRRLRNLVLRMVQIMRKVGESGLVDSIQLLVWTYSLLAALYILLTKTIV